MWNLEHSSKTKLTGNQPDEKSTMRIVVILLAIAIALLALYLVLSQL